ncbi:hypothetical protein H010_05112 [Hydrogenophaga taeniospiralis CCUG 15921]|uniref:LytR/CpsA/Psr regulator C-terminal domain-containing protein n=1 Tax=Hydrogenophaga taeniospiralis CCUG 15921 TaxID=1281780 RepID=A0A9X4NQB2_9BURK|nr:LytR C-terminal domain-containing protein [Hydrogenophaga taeniospiralis]MDG5974621.1 hypothetical protein [Hydrogenophaga taeniospiralis CCUG 15921]
MKLKTLASLSVLGSLMGCSSMMPGSLHGTQSVRTAAAGLVKMAPLPPVGTAMAEHEVLYVTGRSAHGAGHFARAVAYYERTLALKPDHVGALNALGVLHAQAGRTAEALALFDRARVLEPLAAHIYNNMGFALLNANRLEEAEFRLRTARALDPDNQQILENFDLLAKARIEHDERNRQVPQAVPAGGAYTVRDADHPSGPQLVAVAPHVYELRTPGPQAIEALARAQAAPADPPANEPAAPPQPLALALRPALTTEAPTVAQAEPPRPARIEVSNGTGAPRLARHTANKLAPAGILATRLTNASSFQQAQTWLQYLAGQESVVDALQATLPMPVQTVEVGTLGGGTQVRLVLGHDGAGKAIARWAQPDSSRLAVAGLKPRG